MTLLDCYLSSVGMFLPKGSPRKDILAEISEHLVSTMEESRRRSCWARRRHSSYRRQEGTRCTGRCCC